MGSVAAELAPKPHISVMPFQPPSLGSRLAAWLPFVLSAALAALGIRIALREPLIAIALIVVLVALMAPGIRERRRIRRVLQSGDVRSVMAAWTESFTRVPHPETLGPLITATAFASCGWIEQARTALERAVKGPIWEAALEHRLVVETLLDTFEGERLAALEKAERLCELPLPAAGPFVRGRVRTLRAAMAALARAFARMPRQGDMSLLEQAAKTNPLIHWPMRYAAAILAIDGGDAHRARRLIGDAPPWPSESAFHAFHAEIAPIIGLPMRADPEADEA